MTARSFNRTYSEAPIVYVNCSSQDPNPATMLNSSAGGMCFATEKPLRSGMAIFIKLVNFVSDPYWPNACDSYVAEVRWCREENKEDAPVSYQVGVRFVRFSCDHCGTPLNHQAANSPLECSEICPECMELMSSVSDTRLRTHFENYLMGNVL